MLPAAVQLGAFAEAGQVQNQAGLNANFHIFMQMGFFAEAGPVQIFVSNHLIPEDFEFSALDDPCYVSSDEEVKPLQTLRVLQGSVLRLICSRVDLSGSYGAHRTCSRVDRRREAPAQQWQHTDKP